MKNLKKTLAVFLSLAVTITTLGIMPLTASAKNAEDYHLLSSTFNTKTVYNGPTEDASFNIDKDTMLQTVTTYHWNNGNGKTPGSISLLENGVKVGEWQATGRASSGVSNTLWDVFPDYVLKGGNYYTIVDSDNDTWSYNSDSYDIGFVEIRGYGMDSGTSANGSSDSSSNTSANSNKSSSTSYDFISSDWAAQEVISAINYGIVPSNLLTENLTRPIDRRDFAVISLNAYEKMSGDTVSAGSNPFSDTSDSDIIKAYTAGIIAGTSDTTFSPNDLLTREQAAAMLTRAYKKTIYSNWTLAGDDGFPLIYTSAGSFDDSYQISDYARGSVDFMASKGVISGMGDGTFAPKSTVTREQAIAIAVRMINKLDTTPQENTNTNNQTSGSGEVHITFGNGETPEISKNTEYDGYTIGFDEVPSDKVHIEFDADAPASDEEGYLIDIGVPAADDEGGSSIYFITYPASYSNGKASADIDMNEFDDILESVEYGGAGKGFSLDWSLVSKLMPTKKRKGIIAVKLEDRKKLSKDGNFEVHVNYKYYGKGNNKVDVNDLESIGNDLEDIMAAYKKKGYEVKYSSWPMQVYLKDLGYGTYGQYVFGYMDVNVTKLTNGYKRSGTYDSNSGTMYCTLAHEFFHCIERGYVNKVFEARWFDEACGSYYENVFKNEKNVSNSADSYQAAHAEGYHQYKGITPQYVSLASCMVDSERGYGRRPFIEYLMSSDAGGTDFIKKVYAEGGTWTQSGISSLIEKHSGKTLGELAKGFYTTLLTTDKLAAYDNNPFNLYSDIKDGNINDKYIVSKEEINGQDTIGKSFNLVPYGAHIMTLDIGKVPAGKSSFNVRLDRTNMTAIVAAIGSTPKDECEYYYSKKGSDGYEVISNIPVTAKQYLLIVINESAASYDKDGGATAEFNVTFNNAYTGSGWPATAEELGNLPKQYTGTVTYVQKGSTFSRVMESGANIQLIVSAYDMGTSLRITSSDGNYTYLNSDLTYNPSTGMCTGNDVSVQLEPVDLSASSIDLGLEVVTRVHIYEGDKLIAVAAGGGGGVQITRAPEEHHETTVTPSSN